MKKFNLIVAHDEHNGIGKNGKMPWHIPQELQYFKTKTTTTEDPLKKNAVIMGRKTWESIPTAFSPLKDRYNIILSRQKHQTDKILTSFSNSLENALEKCSSNNTIENIFIIGGANLYKQTLFHELREYVYITKIFKTFACDAFFPEYTSKLILLEKEALLEYQGKPFQYYKYK